MEAKKYSKRTAAMRLGISRHTLNNEIRAGNISYSVRCKRVVFFENDLKEYEERTKVQVKRYPAGIHFGEEILPVCVKRY